ncbi:CapA family protein [Paenibacillus sp. TRM 82003]|nr:CapA family protein [Paenibacillus sp. TRM 82003]
MSRSRTKTARRERTKRRRRLAAANGILIAGIAAVVLWNVLGDSSAGEPGRTEAEQSAGTNDGERGNASEPPGADVGTADPVAEEGAEQGAPPTSEPSEGDSTHPSEGTEPSGESDDGSSTDPSAETSSDGAAGDAAGGTVSMAFVGDVLLGEYVGTLLNRHGFDYPYEHVSELLGRADVAAANLETAVTSMSGEKPGIKSFEFRSDPDALPAFREAGFDLVSLANNHSLDFGAEGLRDTMRHLKESELAFVGAGENAEEAYAPAFLEKNGLRIAVLGVTRVIPFTEWKAGANSLGLADAYGHKRSVREIEAAKKEADVVVVLVHWGEEKQLEPEPVEQVELGRRFVDAGADLVIGSHPHVLQGIERYKDRWIAYSLGNFIFTKSKEPLTYDSGILEASCRKGGECELRLTPFAVDTPQPTPMAPERAAAVLERVSGLSVGATIAPDGRVIPSEDAGTNGRKGGGEA